MPNEQITSYEILSDGVIDKLKSSGIPNIAEEALEEMILSHLRTACVKFHSCKKSLSNRDDLLKQFNIKLNDTELEILILFLTIEYLTTNYINVPSLLRQNMSSKDFKVFSSAEHLFRLMDLKKSYANEADKMISIYSYEDSDLYGLT